MITDFGDSTRSSRRPKRVQVAAAAEVAGGDRLVVIIGPAGAGKTSMLTTAIDDLHARGRPVFGIAPTAKAALRARARVHGLR